MPNETTTRGPVAGWRFFVCTECGYKCWIATRDCTSPSKEDCRNPDCDNSISPSKAHSDANLKTDASGNLTANVEVVEYPDDMLGEEFPVQETFLPKNAQVQETFTPSVVNKPADRIADRMKDLEDAAELLRTVLDFGTPRAESYRNEDEFQQARAEGYELLKRLGK